MYVFLIYSFAARGMKMLHMQNAGVMRLLLLIVHLYLRCVWFGEDQRTNTIKAYA